MAGCNKQANSSANKGDLLGIKEESEKPASAAQFICQESDGRAKPTGKELASFSLGKAGQLRAFSTNLNKDKEITLKNSTLKFIRNKDQLVERASIGDRAGESVELIMTLQSLGEETDGNKSEFEAFLKITANVYDAEAVSTMVPSYLGDLIVTNKSSNNSIIRKVVCTKI